MTLSKTYGAKYASWLAELKGKIRSAQLKAAVSVNRELLALYWEIGQSLSQKVESEKWGSAVVEELSKDLKAEFPNQKGFSRSNLFSMKKWYEFYAHSNLGLEKVQQLVGQIPWGHNVLIITKSETIDEAIFYCQKTIENNWSRTVLTHQIGGQLHSRQSKAINNFSDTLPEPHSDLAIETLKDPYKLDFLDLGEKLFERDLENQLVEHITSLTVRNMKALFAQKALYSASPILPQAAFPALPARGGAAGRRELLILCLVMFW